MTPASHPREEIAGNPGSNPGGRTRMAPSRPLNRFSDPNLNGIVSNTRRGESNNFAHLSPRNRNYNAKRRLQEKSATRNREFLFQTGLGPTATRSKRQSHRLKNTLNRLVSTRERKIHGNLHLSMSASFRSMRGPLCSRSRLPNGIISRIPLVLSWKSSVAP
jgi:hypothetical protein